MRFGLFSRRWVLETILHHPGRDETAGLTIKGFNVVIGSKRVTSDFARLMDSATKIKCSEFGQNSVEHIQALCPSFALRKSRPVA